MFELMRNARPTSALALLALAVAGAPARADGPPKLTEAQKRRMTPVVEVVQSQLPGVVNISATHVAIVSDFGGAPAMGLFSDPFDRRRVETNSVGSGAVIHPSGYVLTNAHVIAKASELSIIFSDGRQYPAEVVAALPEDDIAVIKVEAPPDTRFHTLKLGRSDDLMVGETAIAIGNPFGLEHSVSMGIVSAVNRDLEPIEGITFKGVIQTDAAINPGSSGGPLLNILGEQIGVTSAIRNDAQNVGFAIPIDRVRELLPEMLGVEARGRVRLGVHFGEDAGGPGALVERVDPGSPAARAGVRAGARIVGVSGARTEGLADVLVALLEQPVDEPFSLEVQEPDGRARALSVSIEPLPQPDGKKLAWEHFGLRLDELDAETARRLGLRPRTALVVREVKRGSPADRVGVKEGDLVPRIGRYGVRSLDDAGLVLERVKAGDEVGFRIVRIRGRSVYQSETRLQAR